MANEKFKINGVVSEVVPIVGDTGDVLKKTVSGVEWGALDKATQAEAEAGTNDTKIMTPLRVKQVTEQYATKTELENIDLTEELKNLATKAELENKVDKVSGKQLSTNDYTTAEKNKLTGIQAGAQVNAVTSVNGQTGAVTTPDTKYTAGTNVTITGTTISATDTVYDDTALKTRITAVENREDKDTTYTAGTNVQINTDNVISATDTKYTAGTNVSISGTTISATDTTYGVATTSSNGLMSSADKIKLNGVETGAQVNAVTSVNGQTGAVTTPNTTYDVATTSANGLMSSADKTKLNGIETGAEKNNVTSTDISNWNNKVDKVSGKQLSTNDYTTAEKNKLEGIEAGSQKNTITSVQGRTGAVTVSKSDVGLDNVDNVKQMPISGGVLENYREKLVTISDGSIDLSLGNVFQHSLTGYMTYSITNAVNGQAHSFTLILNIGSIARTLTFPASVKWQGGEIPDMSTANKTYVLTFMTVDGGTTWLGMFGGEF